MCVYTSDRRWRRWCTLCNSNITHNSSVILTLYLYFMVIIIALVWCCITTALTLATMACYIDCIGLNWIALCNCKFSTQLPIKISPALAYNYYFESECVCWFGIQNWYCLNWTETSLADEIWQSHGQFFGFQYNCSPMKIYPSKSAKISVYGMPNPVNGDSFLFRI